MTYRDLKNLEVELGTLAHASLRDGRTGEEVSLLSRVFELVNDEREHASRRLEQIARTIERYDAANGVDRLHPELGRWEGEYYIPDVYGIASYIRNGGET